MNCKSWSRTWWWFCKIFNLVRVEIIKNFNNRLVTWSVKFISFYWILLSALSHNLLLWIWFLFCAEYDRIKKKVNGKLATLPAYFSANQIAGCCYNLCTDLSLSVHSSMESCATIFSFSQRVLQYFTFSSSNLYYCWVRAHLSRLRPVKRASFHTSWKCHETSGFLMFSGGI